MPLSWAKKAKYATKNMTLSTVSNSTFLRIFDDAAASSQPKIDDSASASRLSSSPVTTKPVIDSAVNGICPYHATAAGIITIRPNTRFTISSDTMRLSRMVPGFIGIDSRRSLSFAS